MDKICTADQCIHLAQRMTPTLPFSFTRARFEDSAAVVLFRHPHSDPRTSPSYQPLPLAKGVPARCSVTRGGGGGVKPEGLKFFCIFTYNAYFLT